MRAILSVTRFQIEKLLLITVFQERKVWSTVSDKDWSKSGAAQ